MKQFQSEILSNLEVARGYYELLFSWPLESARPEPGQFISVKSFGTTDLILRRPFAIASYERGQASIIYQRRGKATQMLAAKKSGERIDLVGPLGNTFPLVADAPSVLVGGGVGLGPMVYFARWLTERGVTPTLLLGFRDEGLVPGFLERADPSGLTATLCTDDGSLGFHGTTIDWLDGPGSGLFEGARPPVLYACGPNPMMAACVTLARRRRVACWVSMEQVMGCGVGACLGCAVPVHGDAQYARVCTEGPVFDGTTIQWETIK